MTAMNINPRTLKTAYGLRTDVPATIYRRNVYTHVEWHLRDGRHVRVPMGELRQALQGAPTRNGDGRKILFALVPDARAIRPDGGRPAVSVPGMEVF